MDLYQKLIKESASACPSSSLLLLGEGTYNKSIYSEEKNPEIEKFVKSFNTSLCSTKSNESLHHLLLLLPQCPIELLKNEGEKWFRICLTNLAQNKNTSIQPALCLVLTFLVRSSEVIRDLHQQLGKCLGDKNFSSLLMKLFGSGEFMVQKYNLLSELLQVYPGYLLPFTLKLEKALIALLSQSPESFLENELYSAGKIYSALKESNVEDLISLGHGAANIIFEEITETEDYSDIVSSKRECIVEMMTGLSDLNDHTEKLFTACSIICNTFTFISSYFHCYYKGMRNVNPRKLLSFPLRILQVQKTKGLQHAPLALILPSLHKRALQLLDHLLLNIGESLEIYHGILLDHMTSILKLSSKQSTNAKEKNAVVQNNDFRACVYNVLLSLTIVSKGCYAMPDEVCLALISDIKPEKEGLRLKKVRGRALANLTVRKKSKKKGYTAVESNTDNMDSEVVTFTSDEIIVESALQLISKWLEFNQQSMSIGHLEKLRECLFSLAPLPDEGPFEVARIRARYFEALIAIALYPHPGRPPHYSIIINSLSAGATDHDHEVSTVCSNGLGAISFIMSNPKVSIFEDYIALREQEKKKESEKTIESENSDSDEAAKSDLEDDVIFENGSVDDINNLNQTESALSLDNDSDEEDNVPEQAEDIHVRSSISMALADEGIGKEGEACEEETITQNIVTLDDSSSDGIECVNEIHNGSLFVTAADVHTELESLPSKKRKKRKVKLTKKAKKQKQQEENLNENSKEDEEENVDLEEVMASFVDADPDSS